MRPIIFFGSDCFALSHLIALFGKHLPYSVVLVVTGSMSTPVAKYCAKQDILCIAWPKEKLMAKLAVDSILELTPHTALAVVVSFGRFLPQRLRKAMDCIINVHPSLLPRWRGASPLMHTILVGDCISGVSIIRIPSESGSFDTGPILLQRSINLPAVLDSAIKLANFLTPLCVEALIEVLSDLPSKLTCCVSQSHLALAAPKPHIGMSVVDWKRQSAQDIDRLWCALSDWFPLSTSLVLQLPANRNHSKEFIMTELTVGLKERPIILHPSSNNQRNHEDMAFERTIAIAHDLLPNLICKEDISPGDIIFIEKEDEKSDRRHPSRNSLLPLVSVAAGGGSWLGLRRGLVIGRAEARRRPLGALDFYSGYFTSRPNCWCVKRLQERVWYVGRFESNTRNPLYPLPPSL